MDVYALLGILAFVYAGMVFFITYKKPVNIWSIGKIKAFEKVLGKKGTEYFFYVFGLLAVVLGIWLISK
ncbi:MAG: hypothetical protein GX752_09580 [Clostridium sp.]|nr:hypothetical protein [Clostridium sp.]